MSYTGRLRVVPRPAEWAASHDESVADAVHRSGYIVRGVVVDLGVRIFCGVLLCVYRLVQKLT